MYWPRTLEDQGRDKGTAEIKRQPNSAAYHLFTAWRSGTPSICKAPASNLVLHFGERRCEQGNFHPRYQVHEVGDLFSSRRLSSKQGGEQWRRGLNSFVWQRRLDCRPVNSCQPIAVGSRKSCLEIRTSHGCPARYYLGGTVG